MADAKMQIIIDGNANGAVNATKQASSQFSNLMKIFGAGVLAGGGIALVQQGFKLLEKGIDAAIATIKESITAAADAEVQLTKLNTALQSTGNFSQEASDELVAYAESLQKVTSYEDDAIVAVEAMLATFKLSSDEIKVATQATLDLATATGQDLQSAAILMGKAMVGETGTLKRYGIIVDENKLKTEGWRAVIDEINVEFGGQALAQGQTYTGMVERMKNMFGDIKETIGGAFIPVLKTLMEEFTKNGGMLEKVAKKVKEFADAFAKADWQATVDGLIKIGEALGSLISGGKSFDNVDEKAQGFADTLGKTLDTIAGFITAINLTSQSLMILYKTWDLVTMGGPIGVMREGIEQLTYSLEGNREAIINNIIETIHVDEKFKDLDERINTLIETGNNFGVKTDDNKNSVSSLTQILGVHSSAVDNADKKTQNYINEMSGLSGQIEEATGKVTILTNTLNGIPKTIRTNYTIAYHSVGTGAAGGTQGNIDVEDLFRQGMFVGAKPPGKQSGGIVLNTGFVSDLNIPLVKGEAVLPASVVRAIKENRSSFAGLSGNEGGSVTNNFNIAELVVREDADVEKIAQELYSMQISSLRGAGIR